MFGVSDGSAPAYFRREPHMKTLRASTIQTCVEFLSLWFREGLIAQVKTAHTKKVRTVRVPCDNSPLKHDCRGPSEFV